MQARKADVSGIMGSICRVRNPGILPERAGEGDGKEKEMEDIGASGSGK